MIHGLIWVGLLIILSLFGVKGAFEKLTKDGLSAVVLFLVYGGIIMFVFNGGLTEKSNWNLSQVALLEIAGCMAIFTLILSFIIKWRGIKILSLICWAVFIACIFGRMYALSHMPGLMSYHQFQIQLLGFRPPIWLW